MMDVKDLLSRAWAAVVAVVFRGVRVVIGKHGARSRFPRMQPGSRGREVLRCGRCGCLDEARL